MGGFKRPQFGHSILFSIRPQGARKPKRLACPQWPGYATAGSASKVAALPLTASAHSPRASLLPPHCAVARTTTG